MNTDKDFDFLLGIQEEINEPLTNVVETLLKRYGNNHIRLALTLTLVADSLIKRGLADHIHLSPEVMNEISQYQVEQYIDNPLSEQGIVEQTLALNANLQVVLLKLQHIIYMVQTKGEVTDVTDDATTIRNGTEATPDADPSA